MYVGSQSWKYTFSLFLRVMRDVEAVRQEATLLKEQMHTVKEDIKKVRALQS